MILQKSNPSINQLEEELIKENLIKETTITIQSIVGNPQKPFIHPQKGKKIKNKTQEGIPSPQMTTPTHNLHQIQTKKK